MAEPTSSVDFLCIKTILMQHGMNNLQINLLKKHAYAPVMPDFNMAKNAIECVFKNYNIDSLYLSTNVAPCFTVFKYKINQAISEDKIRTIKNDI